MIEFDQETGRLQIGGPVHEKLLTLGALELAKGIVLNPPVAERKPALFVPRPGGPPMNGHGA
jgi:hypothetical protein